MKLLCKKITSHTCLEIFQSTTVTEEMASCSRVFRKPKTAEREEVNRKWYPKVNKYSEKVVFEKTFSGMAEW